MKGKVMVLLVCLSVILLAGCQEKSNAPSPTAPENSIQLKVIKPGTGEVTIDKNISMDGDLDNNIRQALGMPTKEEEAAATQYLSAAQILDVEVIDCVYIKKYSSSAYTDPEAKMWTGTNYHGVFIPVLEYLPNGLAKTIVRDIPLNEAGAKKRYKVVYFWQRNLTANKNESEWYQRNQGEAEFSEEVPELCSLVNDN